MHNDSEVQMLINSIGGRTLTFLSSEVGIDTFDVNYQFHDVQELSLDHLTAIIAVEGQFKVLFAFSMSASLAAKINREYVAELQLTDEQEKNYITDSVCDMVNIVVGNVLANFQINNQSICLSPPIVVEEAKNIYKANNAKFLTSRIATDSGILSIFCIGPKELFDRKLDYIKEKYDESTI